MASRSTSPHNPDPRGRRRPNPPDAGQEQVTANTNSDQILRLIDRAECVLDEMAELEDIVVTLTSAVASCALAVEAPELSVRIRELCDSLKVGNADLPALSDRLRHAAVELGTN